RPTRVRAGRRGRMRGGPRVTRSSQGSLDQSERRQERVDGRRMSGLHGYHPVSAPPMPTLASTSNGATVLPSDSEVAILTANLAGSALAVPRLAATTTMASAARTPHSSHERSAGASPTRVYRSPRGGGHLVDREQAATSALPAIGQHPRPCV